MFELGSDKVVNTGVERLIGEAVCIEPESVGARGRLQRPVDRRLTTALGVAFEMCSKEIVGLGEVVSSSSDKSVVDTDKKVTVRNTLRRMNARCKKDKLVDEKGREIYFFRLIGCWGNPPEDYQEQLAKQQQALERLRKKYTVIEISCNQTGDLRLVH